MYRKHQKNLWLFSLLVGFFVFFHAPLMLIVSNIPAYWGVYRPTSIIQIISSPWIYHTRYVEVSGILHLEFEDQKLYLHEVDYQFDLPNALWLSSSETVKLNKKLDLEGKLVSIKGRFDATFRGRSNTLVGGIRDIKEIEEMQTIRNEMNPTFRTGSQE